MLSPTPLLAGSDEGAAIKDTFQGISNALGVEATQLALAGLSGIRNWVDRGTRQYRGIQTGSR